MAASPVWLIAVDFGSGFVDITEHCEKLTRMRTAHNELRPTVNTANFTVNDLVTSNLFNATGDDLPVTITKDGFAWFVGQIRPNYDTVMASGLERLVIECVDNSINLQERIDESFEWTGYKVCDTSSKSTSIVHQLLVKNGFSLSDMSLTDIDVTITKYTVARFEDKVFKTELSDILYEFGHTLDMGYDGVFVLHDMHPTTVTTSPLTDSDTGHPRNQRRRRQRWEAVRLTWHPVQTFVDELVFSDRTGGTTDTPMSVALANGEFYPPGADADDIYSVYRFPDSEILDVTDEVLTWDKTGALTLDTELYGSKRADIKFVGGVGGGVLTRFDIRGTVIARDLTRIKKEVVYRVANTTRILKHKARFIQSRATAGQFASDKANYYNFSKFTFDFEILTTAFTVNVMSEFAMASDAQNVAIDIRIVSLKEDEYGNRFATAEGISAYSLLSSEVQDVIGAAEILAPSNDQTLFNQAVGVKTQSPVLGDVDLHMGMDPDTDQIIGIDPVGFRIKEFNGVANETRAETAMRVGGGVADAILSGFSKVGESVLSSPGLIWNEEAHPFGTGVGTGINAISFGNSTLVAVGASGRIARSITRGDSWGSLISNPFTTNFISAVRFGSNTFIASGQSGTIARSTDDGVTWGSLISNPFGASFVHGLSFGDTVWVAVSSEIKLARSTDGGVTWGSLITEPFSVAIFEVAFGNGVFIAVGGAAPNGEIARSTDGGVTWGSLITNPFTTAILDIHYNDGVWIAVGQAGEIARSVDGGVTWGSLIVNGFGSSDIRGIWAGDNVWIAIADDAKIARSVDGGLTWGASVYGSQPVSQPFGSDGLFQDVTFITDAGEPRFALVGSLLSVSSGIIATSDYLEAGAGIVEQGSNSDGEYVIFSNGLQICFGADIDIAATGIQNRNIGTYGWSFYNGITAITFPKAFATKPVVAPGGDEATGAGHYSVRIDIVTATTARLVALNDASATHSVGYIAIGQRA